MIELSFQLYSARNYPSLPEFLGKLSQLGYRQVEGFGGLYADAEGLAAELKKHGLTMPTGHFGLDQLEDSATALKAAEVLGIGKIICPFISPSQESQDESQWLALAERLARFHEVYSAEGYSFGWHNHHFEFFPTSTGRVPMEIILDAAPRIEWECDVAWLIRGKADPEAWFDRYGDRITAVHVKDIAPEGQNQDEDGWADIGHGVVGWADLIKTVQAKTRAQYFVAEHDKPSDEVRFATRSIETVRQWK